MPIERLSADDCKALPISGEIYFAPCDDADWWANSDAGLAGYVQPTTSGWGYTVLALENDGRYHANGVGIGYKSRAEATVNLHMRIDDPPSPPFQR